MATLYLDHINRSLPTLREWLDGNWGLLLSHPSDFDDHSLERDRWLEILRKEFRASGVKPIACRCADGEPDRGWASSLTEDEQRVRLTHNEVIDIAARRLRDQVIEIPTPRFAVVVDPTLLCHIILMYQRSICRIAVSPLDLLGSVSNLRRQSARQEMGHLPRRAA
jgi:alkyl hydroperoxide reductase subunit AhpC